MSQAVGSLRFYPYKEFLGAMTPLLQHPDADVRDSARIAVDAIKSERSESALLEQLGKKPTVSDVLVILNSLRWRGTEKSLSQLVTLLRHSNGRVRAAAVKAIENIAKVQFNCDDQDGDDLKSRSAIEEWWSQRQRGDASSPLPTSTTQPP